jgi:hypothetical protein
VVDELGLDETAVGGEDGGYVPCFEEAAAVTPLGADAVAISGEDEGFVPEGTGAASDPADDDDSFAVFGRSAGFVAKPCVEPCVDGITDRFNRTRTTVEELGTSDSTLDWLVVRNGSPQPALDVSVDGSVALVTFGHNPTFALILDTIFAFAVVSPEAAWMNIRHSFRFRLESLGGTLRDVLFIKPLGWPDNSSAFGEAHVVVQPRGGESFPSAFSGNWDGEIAWDVYSNTYGTHRGMPVPPEFWQAGIWYTLSVYYAGAGMLRLQVDDGVTAYYDDKAFDPTEIWTTNWPGFEIKRSTNGPTGPSDPIWSVSIDDFDAPEYTPCTVGTMYDHFARVVPDGFGTASSGAAWTVISTTNGQFRVSNTIGGGPTAGWQYGRFEASAGTASGLIRLPSTGPWQDAAGFVHTFDFWAIERTTFESGADTRLRWSTVGDDYVIDILTSNGSGYVELSTAGGANDAVLPKTDWETVWYSVEVRYIPGTGVELRLWERGLAKPTSPTLSVADAGVLTGALQYAPSAATGGSLARIGIANLDFRPLT